MRAEQLRGMQRRGKCKVGSGGLEEGMEGWSERKEQYTRGIKRAKKDEKRVEGCTWALLFLLSLGIRTIDDRPGVVVSWSWSRLVGSPPFLAFVKPCDQRPSGPLTLPPSAAVVNAPLPLTTPFCRLLGASFAHGLSGISSSLHPAPQRPSF
ncbi:uncharacterized protein BDV14DRAFT_43567 [Aspergillus stella-maris]|uniref:uncharacterized protein n=1 Tax=Aspergillus stella-maris TaxID=1810926 RepID=UPI003CCD461E